MITFQPNPDRRTVSAFIDGQFRGEFTSRSAAAAALGVVLPPVVLSAAEERQQRRMEQAERPRGGWGASRSSKA